MTKIQADRQIENMVVWPVAGISLLPTTWNRNTRYLVWDSSPYKEYI